MEETAISSAEQAPVDIFFEYQNLFDEGIILTGDSQEEEDQHSSSTRFSEKGTGSSRGWETSGDVGGSQNLHVGVTLKGDSSKTKCSG